MDEAEELIAHLQNSVTKIEARVDSQDQRYASLIQKIDHVSETVDMRLDALRASMSAKEEAFNNRLAAKDDTVDFVKQMAASIKDQSETLQKQTASRWNIVTGMTGFVALAFAINFVYEIYRVKEVMDAKQFLQDGATALAEHAKIHSGVLGRLAEAESVLARAYRELARGAYSEARDISAEAIVDLNETLRETGASIGELAKARVFDSKGCTFGTLSTNISARIRGRGPGHAAKDSNSIFAQSLSPEALRGAAISELFGAHELHARASYFAGSKDDVPDDGRTMMLLANERWESYHWVGLAAMDRHDYDQAVTCFEKSVNQKSRANKDHINLAELNFVQGKYRDAQKYSDAYLSPLNYPFKSPIDVVAWFYLNLSKYLDGDNANAVKEFREKMKGLSGDISLEGTFSADELYQYLNGPKLKEISNSKPDAPKTVKAAVECLTKRACDN